MQKRLLFLISLMLTFSLTLMAQVTTSSMAGKVTLNDANGEDVIGATVVAVHKPSGTRYTAVTNVNGRYTLTGMRTGGPYEVEVSYIGFQTKKYTDIQLALGQTSVLDVQLSEGSEMLKEVEIVASARNTMRSDRSGAVTSLNGAQMAAIPTIGRSMTDIMKMTPQSSSAGGMAIGGGNYRQSSITVDGAAFNNAFGLGSSPLPGGGTPISLDALDQMTISITPYDVRQSGFTGGGINAVTKSGTNEFKGSLYTYITSTSLKGNRVGNTVFAVDNGHNDTYGISLGGPIIKDKLFFFVNGEYEDNLTAGPEARAGDGSVPYTNTNRRPQIDELESLSTYMQNTYGLTTGPWQGFNVKTPAYRILARLDWNITDNHKFNIRFTKSNRKSSSGASSSRSIGSNQANAIYGGNQNTYGSGTYYGMSSLSSRYYAEYRFTSFAAELNSKFGKLNNTLRGTYSFQDQPRSTEYNDAAPVVEILMNDGQNHYPSWALMGDVFTYGNLAQTKNTVITDEINITLGKHNLFGGLQFEHNFAANGYAQAAAGYYAFEATPDEVAVGNWSAVFSRAPRLFGITYGNNDAHSMFTSKMNTNQWSLYFQDNMSLSDRFRMSVGVRFELPSYPSLKDNFNEGYYNLDFGGKHFRTDNVPNNSISFSPRVGFNWDITGDRKYILRGGTGLFVGRMPFVWLVSSVGNSGMGQTSYVATASNGKKMPTFTMNQEDMLKQINATSSTSIPGNPTILSEDLRMPKTWKASLAFDAKLPYDIDFTVEGIYNRDLNPVVVSNANVYWDGTSTIDLGHGDVRHKMSTYNSQSAYVLENAGSKAYYASLSFQLHKAFDFGLDLNASYTFSKAKSYTEGIGDQVSSAYNNYRNSIHAVNDNETGYATYVAPNRLLVSASYKLKESKNATSTFSLVYDGYQYGYLGSYSYSRYSYIFSSNVNNDPSAPGNLIYVPASRQELNNWDFKEGKVDGEVYTADMQRDDFWSFIQQDNYLKNRTGQYAERGGAKMPWHHQLDFRYLRDMNVTIGKTKHSLQLGMDVENLLNFLCKDWGLYKQITGNTLLSYDAKTQQYSYNLVNGARHLTTSQNYESTASTYRIMFTLRYLFN
ncbi:carboxypeptidase regulatory-like domain-containing protein [Xylanibacter ruminicola]|uniref:Carboxypeptidase regulatory-like domain-containing protein n=1 Tax=Xylanibacter ruminicola TaxID=839 RepID=A0A1M6RVF9_XYLRU|nr:carboxypeptidase regulatory-like domain-containing protein [Xylanibacter ruminicola]SHK36456.1 Carboxypeptidase regulatory-like domain-containing protein [Xylanibacter ruminicola]